jgi:deazaflavin-dependent oxidoreductase (nitroreductase family)
MSWLQNHIDEFRANGGKLGGMFEGRPVLLLTTTGRKSGQPRTAPMMYLRDDGHLYVFASKGGAPSDPHWYRNLVADPEVRVQVGAERFAATARTASAEEKARLWPVMTAVWPDYDTYQTRTDRDIPVVVLTPA